MRLFFIYLFKGKGELKKQVAVLEGTHPPVFGDTAEDRGPGGSRFNEKNGKSEEASITAGRTSI